MVLLEAIHHIFVSLCLTPSVSVSMVFLLFRLTLGGNKLGPMTVAMLLTVIRFVAELSATSVRKRNKSRNVWQL